LSVFTPAEITGDYRIILPLMLAIVLSTLASEALSRVTIHTLKLRRRGIDLRALCFFRSRNVRHGDVVDIDLAEEMPRTTNAEAQRRGLDAPARVMVAEQLEFEKALGLNTSRLIGQRGEAPAQ
jgi:hypothetical protein